MRQTWEQPSDLQINGLLYSFSFIPSGMLCLTITGRGRITKSNCQQVSQRDRITEIRISEGITEIGANAFAGYCALKSLWLPGTLRTVKHGAFSECCKLEQIVYAGCTKQFERVKLPGEALPAQFYQEEKRNGI